MMPAGLVPVCQPEGAEAAKTARHIACYFSFEDMIKNQRHRLLPYTAADASCARLRAALDLISKKPGRLSSSDHHLATVSAPQSPPGASSFARPSRNGIRIPFRRSGCRKGSMAPRSIRTAYRTYNTSLGSGLSKGGGQGLPPLAISAR